MSWHFSQALVGAFSEERSLGGKPFVPLNMMPTHGMCWLPGRTTDAFRPSRSGMTCEPLTADRGAELLMWCLADSRARTSVQPERVQELEENEADSGERWHELLVKFDPASCGWKTARCLWEEGLDWSCLTLPRWGSLHDGELWERATPGLRTSARESGFLPTPCRFGNGGTDNTAKWASLGVQRRKMNPNHQEWLMGWPVGWTESTAPATDKFRQWLDSHGKR
jgi:hypothetical protein